MEHKSTVVSIPVHVDKTALNGSVADVRVKTKSATADPLKNNANTDDGVRVLTLNEYKAAAYSLAVAFWEDESCRYFIHVPDRADWTEEQKWELHLQMMEYITYAHLLKGLVVSAGPNYDCVALWMPPGHNMDDYLTIFRSGLWRLSYQLSREGRKRFFSEFLPLLGDTKAQVLGADRDQDSWYLVYIGTKPSGRGKGYARRVISHVTRRADREGRCSYLESSHAVNRMIYGKLGFELRKTVYLQRNQKLVDLDIMVREPNAEPIAYSVAPSHAAKMDSDRDSGVDVQ